MAVTNLMINTDKHPTQMVMELDPELPNERAIIGYLANGRLYEPDVATAILRMVRPGDVVMDVGANIGFFSVLMGLAVGPEGRVISFEPGANNIPRLMTNIALNKLKNVILIDKPASNIAEDITFYINSDNSGGNALWDPGEFPGNLLSQRRPTPLTMRATTIDHELHLLGLPPPKFIKIDTEGAEHLVLQGARRLLSEGKVPYIIAELHSFGLAKMNSSQMGLRRFMAGFGYDTFAIYHNGCLPKLIPRGTRLMSRYIINVLFSAPENIGRLWHSDWFDPACFPTPPEAK